MNNPSYKNSLGISLALAAATLLASGCTSVQHSENNAHKAKVSCYGVNSCKGNGACATMHNACRGQNSCQGMGLNTELNKEECQAKGGSLYQG